MGSLQRDPAEVREFIENIDPNRNGAISFEEFIDLMQNVEKKIVQGGTDPQQQAQYFDPQQLQQQQIASRGGLISI